MKEPDSIVKDTRLFLVPTPIGNLEDMTLFTLVLGMVVWFGFFVWAMIHRFRIGWLERELRVGGLDEAIATRRAEAVGTGGES